MESKVVGCEIMTNLIKPGLAMQNLALPCMIMTSKHMFGQQLLDNSSPRTILVIEVLLMSSKLVLYKKKAHSMVHQLLDNSSSMSILTVKSLTPRKYKVFVLMMKNEY